MLAGRGYHVRALIRRESQSAALALIYALFLAGLIAATFIDFEHFIIPDEITIGGMVAGFFCSFLLPALHGQAAPSGGLRQSLLGMAVGAGFFLLGIVTSVLVFVVLLLFTRLENQGK